MPAGIQCHGRYACPPARSMRTAFGFRLQRARWLPGHFGVSFMTVPWTRAIPGGEIAPVRVHGIEQSTVLSGSTFISAASNTNGSRNPSRTLRRRTCTERCRTCGRLPSMTEVVTIPPSQGHGGKDREHGSC